MAELVDARDSKSRSSRGVRVRFPPSAPLLKPMQEISWPDFEKIELRVGTITEAKDFPEAHKPAYQIWADFGEEIGIKKSSAQITDHYTKEDLIGKQIVGVVNFPPKQIGPFTSEFLITGFVQNDGVILANPDKDCPNGLKLA